MTLKQALKFFDSQAHLARTLKISPQAITRWAKTGIPALRQYQILEMTAGRMKK